MTASPTGFPLVRSDVEQSFLCHRRLNPEIMQSLVVIRSHGGEVFLAEFLFALIATLRHTKKSAANPRISNPLAIAA